MRKGSWASVWCMEGEGVHMCGCAGVSVRIRKEKDKGQQGRTRLTDQENGAGFSPSISTYLSIGHGGEEECERH